MKWSIGISGRASACSFPGLLGRGLIEVSAWGVPKWKTSRSFPGLLGRGLIEVRRSSDDRARSHVPFPGLLGRGLIEVASTPQAPHIHVAPSPVYWAGASLKCRWSRRRGRE